MYSVSNLGNVLCTTNHINPIELEPGERRFVVFQCKKVEKYDAAYFQQFCNGSWRITPFWHTNQIKSIKFKIVSEL